MYRFMWEHFWVEDEPFVNACVTIALGCFALLVLIPLVAALASLT